MFLSFTKKTNAKLSCVIDTGIMWEEQLRAFIERLNSDESLQQEIQALNDMLADDAIAADVVALAQREGVDLRAQDLVGEELAAEELETVAGGKTRIIIAKGCCRGWCSSGGNTLYD